MRRAGALVAALSLAAAVAAPVRGAATRVLETSAADLQRGEADGVGITQRGQLFLAPRIAPLGPALPAGGAAHVWAVASDASGNAYLGTGPDGRIVKVPASGQPTVFFTAGDPMVTALAFLPGGDLLAGTAPEGRIYRVKPNGTGSVWCELDERYVWALAVGRDGTAYAGTGEKGVVYRLDKLGKATPLFDSEEAHIVSLSVLPDGALLAGGAGRGLVYRIDAEGHALVLHDDDLAEAHAVVAEPDGSILAALVAAPEPERRPPAVRIQVAGGSQVGEAVVQDERAGGPTMQGVIEGLPDYGEEGGKRTRGRVVRISREGAVTELWRSSTEAPFSLVLDHAGRPLFGAGEPARVYRIEPGGDVALLATLREGQVTGLLRDATTITVATSNPAATYTLDESAPERGVYLSRPLDAGGSADWGTVRWLVDGDARRAEVYTRTGNTSEPDATWSAWSPALGDPSGSAVPNPPGRFLQWRVRLLAGPATRVGAPWATYVTENRPPQLREARLDPEARSTSGKVTLKWSAFDPDTDLVSVDVQYRPAAGGEWTSGARSDPPAPKPGEPVVEADAAWRDGKAAWDTAALPEGAYRVRLVGSDQSSNPAGAGDDAVLELPMPLVVDRTPPAVTAKRVAGGGIEVEVKDGLSAVARLEVVGEGRVLFAPRPVDRVADSAHEVFRLSAAEAGPAGARTLRAVDAAGNVAEAPVPAP